MLWQSYRIFVSKTYKFKKLPSLSSLPSHLKEVKEVKEISKPNFSFTVQENEPKEKGTWYSRSDDEIEVPLPLLTILKLFQHEQHYC